MLRAADDAKPSILDSPPAPVRPSQVQPDGQPCPRAKPVFSSSKPVISCTKPVFFGSPHVPEEKITGNNTVYYTDL